MTAAVRGRGVRRRAGLALGLALGAVVLGGCPGSEPDPAPSRTGRPTATTGPTSSAPATVAPPTGQATIGPAVTVELPLGGGQVGSALGLVARRAGAVVLVGEPPPGSATRLLTVSADGTRTASTAVPTVASPWDVHLLPDATVVVTGLLADEGTVGYAVVDVTTGRVRTVVAERLDAATSRVVGRSVVSPDGRTVWLFSGALVDGRFRYLLSGHEVTTGGRVAARSLLAELRGIHVPDQELDVVGLAWSPGGGVVLTVNVFPPGTGSFWSPVLLAFDAALEPLPGPVRLSRPGDRSTAQALAVAQDGTAFVLLQGFPHDRLVAFPRGAHEPEPRLELPGPGVEGGLVLDARGRAVLPDPAGVRRVDPDTGDTTDVDLGCPGVVTVRRLAGSTTSALWVLGDCFEDGARRPLLWSVR